MTKKTLVILLVVLIVVAALYFVLGSDSATTSNEQDSTLLSTIDGEKVAGITLVQGKEEIELKKEGETWVVPSRGGYPANGQQVLSLLLKVFDLSSTQKLPTGPDSVKKLELDDKGVENGRLKLVFSDAQGKELGGLYFGKTRMKDSGPSGSPAPPSAGGQYVRRINGEQVYLIGLPVTYSASVSAWIKTTLLNVLRASIEQVEQASLDGEKEKEDFVLKRTESQTPGALELVGEVPPEHEIKSEVVNQIGGGLENLRIADVHQSSSESLKDLKFDKKTIFKTSTGLVYEVVSAEREGQIYARFSAAFDPALADALRARHESEQAKIKEEAVKKAAAEKKHEADKKEAVVEEESKEGAPEASTKESTATEDAQKEDAQEAEKSTQEKQAAPLKLSSAEEASKLSKQFEPWIFEFPSFQGEKYRKVTEDLFKKKEEENPAE